MNTETLKLVDIAPWRWYAVEDGGIYTIKKAAKVPDASIQHLLDHADGMTLIRDEVVPDRNYLEGRIRLREWAAA